MKKILLAAMVLLAGVSFTSCSSSDDDGNQQQVFDASKAMSGKWKLSKVQDFPLPIKTTLSKKEIPFHSWMAASSAQKAISL